MALMKVEDALMRLLSDVEPLASERIPLAQGLDRILAENLCADRNQPPFAASAMDGYAVKSANITDLPTRLQVVGEVPAGQHFPDIVHKWEAVRIFTGAPVPEGADAILIQENAERDGAFLLAKERVKPGQFIRPIGLDFKKGDMLITKGTKMGPAHLSLAASMNHATLPVLKRPKLAVLATGNELVLPGEDPSDDQIIASNNIGVLSLAQRAGADCLDLGIARDNEQDIAAKVSEAKEAGVDILVTSGGVSVGEHDLVQDVLKKAGMALDFWRIAMRPGKPLMAGKLDATQVLGLPGNPVSALICATLFLLPLIRKMQGDNSPQPLTDARLGADVAANDHRQSYLRAMLSQDDNSALIATPFTGQDSAMLSGLARADALLIRPPHAEAGKQGESCQVIRL